MAYRVKLKKKWKNVFGKEYPVNTILTLIKSTSLDLVERGVAEKYEGEYPPRSKTKMNLEQLNRK